MVIHQADAMTLAASNALLKTLEEPAENVLMLLISDSPCSILPTIRSRLQSFSVSHVTPISHASDAAVVAKYRYCDAKTSE